MIIICSTKQSISIMHIMHHYHIWAA